MHGAVWLCYRCSIDGGMARRRLHHHCGCVVRFVESAYDYVEPAPGTAAQCFLAGNELSYQGRVQLLCTILNLCILVSVLAGRRSHDRTFAGCVSHRFSIKVQS